ncbi:MAG: efflux RND transporter periplasmic adaptor subunit [Fulvimarina manganoxydans]|uniref:efflux RND transporter periplasmic adaptor subunit n=1 Tax=Fulvimarina manganoxydans TaxID=937218 RepID=UPI0023558046|nr:efflux RND transporter periplasmic adaptor subunit [Fulvimarina manganoxydans]MCK5931635.1 efflux RND transporter periplasmic adaptor subunit [Fulvimarina manganoxydans]
MMARAFSNGLVLFGLIALAACSEAENETAETPQAPRPVVSIVAEPMALETLGYSGMIAPRYETALAFRTLGRIVAREVDVGDQVEKGETLAAIDAETLAANVRSAKARLANARIQARTARESEQRTQSLFAENTVSQSDLDVARQSRSVAEAELKSAEAQLDKAENALTFAVLTAPFDGVVTACSADVGDVVSAGESVMTLARTDEREAVVDVPASETSKLAPQQSFRVVLQIDPSIRIDGKLREIAPQADPLTRTNRVRIALDDAPEAFRIGALITAVPIFDGAAMPIRIPETALFKMDGETKVWVVDEAAASVKGRSVTTEAAPDGMVTVVSGLSPGERVVTAGVGSLKDGQAISLQEGIGESGAAEARQNETSGSAS